MSKYVFKRYELKYILTPEQYNSIIGEIEKYLYVDEYGETTIQSLYYDTDSFLLIRNSIERPSYKEKIRVRSYGLATPEKMVFLELKKKYNKVVFKRRVQIKENQVNDFIMNGIVPKDGQIEKEIIYFCNFYKNLKPGMLLLYDRTAYRQDGTDLRITFDRNVRYRTERLNLCEGLDGTLLLPDGNILMEIKTGIGYPRWLVDLLNANKIYKQRFSKYVTAYQIELKKQLEKQEEQVYV